MSISSEDLKFLRELQHELNTQDTVGQADPRFWVVMQDEWRESNYDIDRIRYFDEGNVAMFDLDEAIEMAYQDQIDLIGEEPAKEWLEGYDLERVGEDQYQGWFREEESKVRLIKENLEGTIVTESLHRVIAPNTMFLTLRECREHIERNGYHYENPRPYAMTAWRSPQVERLIKILQTADFLESEEE